MIIEETTRVEHWVSEGDKLIIRLRKVDKGFEVQATLFNHDETNDGLTMKDWHIIYLKGFESEAKAFLKYQLLVRALVD